MYIFCCVICFCVIRRMTLEPNVYLRVRFLGRCNTSFETFGLLFWLFLSLPMLALVLSEAIKNEMCGKEEIL